MSIASSLPDAAYWDDGTRDLSQCHCDTNAYLFRIDSFREKETWHAGMATATNARCQRRKDTGCFHDGKKMTANQESGTRYNISKIFYEG